jgi:hypothetical protein
MAKRIQQQPIQLGLFEPEKPVEYVPYYCYIAPEMYDEFMSEFSQFCIEIKKWEVGVFYQMEFLTSDVSRVEMIKNKYFKY